MSEMSTLQFCYGCVVWMHLRKFNLCPILQKYILSATPVYVANADIFNAAVLLGIRGPLWSFMGKVDLLLHNFDHFFFHNFRYFLLQQIILIQCAHNNTLIDLYRLRLIDDYFPEAGARSQIKFFYLTQSNVKVLQGEQEFNLQLLE